MEFKTYRTNAAARYFESLTKVVYIITSTNFWFEDDHLPRIFVKIYKSVSKFLEAISIAFAITGVFAQYTQHNLTEKQHTDMLFKSVCIFIIYLMYGFTSYHKETVKELLFSLTVTLKGLYNNDTVERKMIKKSWMYLACEMILGLSTVITVGIDGAVQALNSNAPFTPIITIWPDIEDRSVFAAFVRIFTYIIWGLLVARFSFIFSIIVCTSICLGYQFANLSEYFLSLNDIFDGEGSQKEKEIKYEKAVKVGIKMHNITLNCVRQLQLSCNAAYTGQVVINVGGMVLLLIQMMQTERTLRALAPILCMAAVLLLSSGFFTCCAADITFEAERLPTAMFHSGWHNCTRQSSVRVRKMITIAMAQAQNVVVIKALYIIELSYESFIANVVVIKALYIIELSYESFIAVVKSSYSVFSVIY